MTGNLNVGNNKIMEDRVASGVASLLSGIPLFSYPVFQGQNFGLDVQSTPYYPAALASSNPACTIKLQLKSISPGFLNYK